jgi:hypothetical protein
MPGLNYLNFVLVLEKALKGYRAAVIDSPAGQAEAIFKIPFTKQDLEIFYLRVGRRRGTQVDLLKWAGQDWQMLFECCFYRRCVCQLSS